MTRRAVGAQRVGRLTLSLLLVLSLLPSLQAAEPDERGLWTLWQPHAEPPYDHEALLAACRAFTRTHTDDPFVVVSGTLAGWHLLRLGREDEAAKVFSEFTFKGSGNLRRAGTAISLAWLTRLDREKVGDALQFYYRKHVAYPRRLDDLVAYAGLPASLAFSDHDRWDLTWSYRLTGLTTIPGLLDQKYKLESRRLGDGSDLAEALTVPCGGLLGLQPVRVRSATPGREVVELRRRAGPEAGEEAGDGKPVVMVAGTRYESFCLAYVGRRIMILSDYHHWSVLPRPETR